MDAREFLRSQLDGGAWILVEAASALADDEFYERLPHAGESADWIFGHIASNEDWFLTKLTGSERQIPEEIYSVYQPDFPPPTVAQGVLDRNGMIELFQAQRQRSLDALLAADTSTWDQKAPEGLPSIFDTVGAVWGILGTHQYWHIGQLMTIRTMLGQPPFDFSPHRDPAASAAPQAPTSLVLPSDGPRIQPRQPQQVNANVRAEFDKAMETWGIHNNLVRTLGCHPQLALTEVDYANAFIFQKNTFAEIPKPGSEAPGELVLFPSAGFVDRIVKELVISFVSLKNRARYSITHHTVISFGVLSELVAGDDADAKGRRAEAMLLALVDESGQESFRDQTYEGAPLYSDLQLAALELASKVNRNAHVVGDAEFERLRDLFRADARAQIEAGPLRTQFGDGGPDDAYVEAFVDGALVELTWCIVHFSGLLNRWFTVLKMRDEEFAVAGDQTFVDVYNAVVPDSIKRRNNALLGPSGWGT
jgi:DinB superfamily